MARSVEQIEHDIETLSAADKQRVFKHLLAELDLRDEPEAPRDEIEAAWIVEAERRAQELANGTVETVPLEDVMRRARERLNRDR